jgi:hypothetical protein
VLSGAIVTAVAKSSVEPLLTISRPSPLKVLSDDPSTLMRATAPSQWELRSLSWP